MLSLTYLSIDLINFSGADCVRFFPSETQTFDVEINTDNNSNIYYILLS